MDWRYDSRGRAPALQAQSPDFKPQSHKKKKKKLAKKFQLFFFNGTEI
jgi:hypothetical protein